MAKTRAQHNRALRQENLREWLSQKRLVEHVFDLAIKIAELTPEIHEDEDGGVTELTASAEFNLKKYKTAAELNLKLANKYLPDVKQVEIEANINDGRSLDQFTASELLALRDRLQATADTGSEGATSKVH